MHSTVWLGLVAAYLLWFGLRLLLSDDDCGIELHCRVVTRPPVGRERWSTAGYVVDWLEVRSGIEEAATGAECCCRMSGWAVVCPVHEASWPGIRALCLPSWGILSWCVVDRYFLPNEWSSLVRTTSFYSGRLLSKRRERESALLWWLSFCGLGRFMDWCADRGRRAVRWNGGLNKGKRCDDMWVFPQMYFVECLLFSACVIVLISSMNGKWGARIA